jgi:hypothetical protein
MFVAVSVGRQVSGGFPPPNLSMPADLFSRDLTRDRPLDPPPLPSGVIERVFFCPFAEDAPRLHEREPEQVLTSPA